MFEMRDLSTLKLPTFREFCKQVTGPETKPARIVKTIWWPNKYPSLTLETERFRLRIPDTNEVYTEILSWVRDKVSEGSVIAIWVVSPEDFGYRIDYLAGEDGVYREIGDLGVALERVTKAKANRRRDSQKAVDLDDGETGA